MKPQKTCRVYYWKRSERRPCYKDQKRLATSWLQRSPAGPERRTHRALGRTATSSLCVRAAVTVLCM
ncbi:hypothetical protein GN956_G20949 [Arapaima gigas]